MRLPILYHIWIFFFQKQMISVIGLPINTKEDPNTTIPEGWYEGDMEHFFPRGTGKLNLNDEARFLLVRFVWLDIVWSNHGTSTYLLRSSAEKNSLFLFLFYCELRIPLDTICILLLEEQPAEGVAVESLEWQRFSYYECPSVPNSHMPFQYSSQNSWAFISVELHWKIDPLPRRWTLP